MFIISTVTGIACGRGFGLDHGFLVATFTFCCGMFAFEWILRVFIMIKRDDLPSVDGMAVFAFFPEDSFVITIFLVATITVSRGAFESLIFVAIVTGNHFMLPYQRESRLAVIKLCFFPLLFRMTVRTIWS